MKKNIGFETILLFHFFSSLVVNATAQTKNIEKCFIYNSLNIGGNPISKKFYFIISDTKTIYFKGFKYSSFVLSKDSSDTCGFIRYSLKRKCYFFLSKYYL